MRYALASAAALELTGIADTVEIIDQEPELSLQTGTSTCYADARESCHPDDPGHTFTREIHWSPQAPCERVLVEPRGGIQASDHYGVVADLTVPDRPRGTWAPGWTGAR